MRFALTFAVNNAETKVNLDIVQISSATENLEPLMTFFLVCFRFKFQSKKFLSYSQKTIKEACHLRIWFSYRTQCAWSNIIIWLCAVWSLVLEVSL